VNRLDPDLENLVRRIHAAGRQFVIAITGGGSAAIGWLLGVPGGSRTLLEAIVPYSAQAMVALLGARPERFCSEPTARAMAMAAFGRARGYAGSDVDLGKLIGLACTASLASDRPKRGAHRAHFAWQSVEQTSSASLELVKGARDRGGEEDLVARLILSLLADSVAVDARIEVPLLASERIRCQAKCAPAVWQQLLLGQRDAVRHGPPVQAAAGRRVIFPGAFNPRHAGHRTMAQIAQSLLNAPVEHEISIENVDKPALDYVEMDRRVGYFSPDETVWLTRAPLFTDKARLFPQATFVVGADTLLRIADARYYGQHEAHLAQAINELAARGSRFLVFGRLVGERFQALGDLKLPPALMSLCDEVPPERFRVDISSTQLRRSDPAFSPDEE
jgi:nicotinamide mononucleotide (NMN) deamidase PncC